MSILEQAYIAVLRGARPALRMLAHGEHKLARGIRGRRGVLDRLAAWAAAGRDPPRPLVWMHAPSVGEGLQGRATLEALRARRPDVQVAYTFFSPSAERFASTVRADWADYLPLDTPAAMRGMLSLLRPDALVFSKTDVWPVLTREAAAIGVPMALLGATLPPGSSRLRGAARALLAPAYTRLAHVAAISADDAARFGSLGVPPERRSVMGDAHFDRVLARADAVDPASPLLAPLQDASRPTIVAGSTWPADEERLLGSLARLAGEGVRWRLLLVPHEPTAAHLAASERLLERHGLSYRRLGDVPADDTHDVVLVDRVGVLGELYALASIAYVGGGWGRAGLHSVLEPAAYGVPILFGPHHANAREAGELVRAGAAFAVPDAAALGRTLRGLLADAESRLRAGRAARAYVHANLGAAARGALVIERLLTGG
jgi:3-deoxy-D-manno-octulosonic-acid transferase